MKSDAIAPSPAHHRPAVGTERSPQEARAVSASPDERALFHAVYAQHRDAIWRYFVRRLGDVDVAEDLTSEVFVVAWRRRADGPAASLPWLYGIARKVLAGDRRAARRRAALDERLAAHLLPAAAAPAEPDTTAAAVVAALAALSVEDRELLVLTAWEGLSAKELAVALGCRPSAARVRLHRARRRLEHHLNDHRHPRTTP